MSSPETPRYPRVLLIDDDFISREVLALVLETYGFPVESAQDGAEALNLIEKAALPYELILMDTQMPGLSGLDLIKVLRQRSSARIVAISGSEVVPSIRQAADGFLLKPIEAAALVALLDVSTGAASPAASPNAEQVNAATAIDPVVLGKLQAMMPPASVREIYAAVASDMKTRLVTLQAAIDADDGPEVARIAHIVKGGCSMVGLTSATRAAASLESSNTPVIWPKELLQLHFALEALESILVHGLL